MTWQNSAITITTMMPILGALARWGYTWAWSSPRAAEDVDLGAIFRLAAGLVEPDGNRGTVEFRIDDGEERLCYAFTVGGGQIQVEECDANRPADAQRHQKPHEMVDARHAGEGYGRRTAPDSVRRP